MDEGVTPEKRPKLLIVAAAFVVVCGIAAAALLAARSSTPEPSPVASPDVSRRDSATPNAVGESYEQVSAYLSKRGFTVRPVLEDGSPADPEKAANAKVLSQSPIPSDQLPPGTTIDVVVDCGASCVPSSGGAEATQPPQPVTCSYPGGLTEPTLSVTRIRPGEAFKLSGPASAGEPVVVAFLDNAGVSEPGPFAKYLGSGKAKPAPNCEYEIDLTIPIGVKPGRYYLFPMFDARSPAGSPVQVEVVA